jgi:hypothetical protein
VKSEKLTPIPDHIVLLPVAARLLNWVLGVARHVSGRAVVIVSTVVAVVGFLSINDPVHSNFLNIVRYGDIHLTDSCYAAKPGAAATPTAVPDFLPTKAVEPQPSSGVPDFFAPKKAAAPRPNSFLQLKPTAPRPARPFALAQLAEPNLHWYCGLYIPYRWLLSMCVILAGWGLIRWRPRRT